MQYKLRAKVDGNLIDNLLFHRGMKTPEEKERFLNPDYDNHIHNPFLLKDAEKSAKRIIKAIENNEKTVIYSDYDADGIPAGVILHDFFKKIGFKNFINYIPHRHDEGFGLHNDAIEQFSKDKVDLIITLDCGIGDIEAVKLAKQLETQEIFIAGGAQIFNQGIKLADKLYLTIVKGDFEGNAFFPNYSRFNTIVSKEENQDGKYNYTFLELTP